MNSNTMQDIIKRDASWKAHHLMDAPEGGGGYVLPGSEFGHIAEHCQAQMARLFKQPVPQAPDPLDANAQHFVWVNANDRLVAACRLVVLYPETLAAGYSYTATLYDWPEKLPHPMSWPVAELSRLFVEPRSQTNTPPLLLLWRTIAELLKRPEMPRFWVGSLNSYGLSEHADEFLREWPYLNTQPTDMEAKHKLQAQTDRSEAQTTESHRIASTMPAEMARIGSIARSGISSLPPLWRLYYDMGARVLARGQDPNYPQATDALLVIDRQTVPAHWKRKLKFDYPLV